MYAPSPAGFENSFATVMDEYRTHLAGRLIDDDAFLAIQNHAALFPLVISKFWCLELSLSDEKKKADLLFCISDPYQFSHYFSDVLPSSFSGAEADFLPRILRFSQAWREAKSFAFSTLVNIWFEYDFESIQTQSFKPNFFYAPAKGMHPLSMVAATDTVLTTISEETMPKATWAHLLHCLQAVPKGGWVSQIGKMFARNDESLRLFIQQIPKYEIERFLQQAGYKWASDSKLTELLNDCYQLASQVDVDIDITHVTGDTVGLECSFNEMEQAILFLNYLAANGLCTQAKYKAIKHYLTGLCSREDEQFQPFLSHFKIVYHPHKPVTAKVYVGFADRSSASKIIRTKYSKLNV